MAIPNKVEIKITDRNPANTKFSLGIPSASTYFGLQKKLWKMEIQYFKHFKKTMMVVRYKMFKITLGLNPLKVIK